MAKKKETTGNMTLAIEEQETTMPKAAPKPPENPPVGLLAQEGNDPEAARRTDPPVDLDTAEQEAYLALHNLCDTYEKKNGNIICKLLDTKGRTIIGYDPKTKQPMAFGLTEQRALFNAVQRHKQLQPIVITDDTSNQVLRAIHEATKDKDVLHTVGQTFSLGYPGRKRDVELLDMLSTALTDYIDYRIANSEGGLRAKLRDLLD